MEKIISASAVRKNLGKVLREIMSNDDHFIVERHGEPVAVVVPVELYRQWQRDRQVFFDKLREISESANVPEEEAEPLIEEAISWVRKGAI